jgi:hypothetical protein
VTLPKLPQLLRISFSAIDIYFQQTYDDLQCSPLKGSAGGIGCVLIPLFLSDALWLEVTAQNPETAAARLLIPLLQIHWWLKNFSLHLHVYCCPVASSHPEPTVTQWFTV